MARDFSITVATPSLQVAPSRRGELAFTVSNMTGARVRARANIKMDQGPRPEWLTLRGQPIRELPPDGTEVFMVDIQVPPATPQGRYTFTLLVVDDLNPDERYVVGPQVVLEVPATAAVPDRYDWRWLALVAGIIVILGGATATFLALRHKGGGTGGSGPSPAQLGEPCADRVCAGGLTCGSSNVCLGAAGFVGCSGNQQCATGLCATGTCTACPSPGLICGNRCVSPATDQENCGGCGRKCILGAICTNGLCLRPGVSPPQRLNPTQQTRPPLQPRVRVPGKE